MLPFIYADTPHLGPIPINPFGLMIALGFLTWDSVCTRRAKALGLDAKEFRNLQLWGLGAGVVIAHVVEVVFYHPHELLERPWALLFFWEKLSSIGGMIGCIAGGYAWKHLEWTKLGPLPWPKRRAVAMDLLPGAETILATVPIGWAFGRAGCAIIHDHPGLAVATPNLLTVAYPRFDGDGLVSNLGPVHVLFGGDPRYDLGLLEMLWWAGMVAVVAWLWRRGRPRWQGEGKPPLPPSDGVEAASKRWPRGIYIGIVCLAYAPARFVLDFLRLREGEGSDLRLALGLTFAQWMAFVIVGVGVGVIRWARRGAASSG